MAAARTQDAAPAKVIAMSLESPADWLECVSSFEIRTCAVSSLSSVLQNFQLIGTGPKPFAVNPVQAFSVSPVQRA